MEQKICIHCYVTGRVQGVWYRASTQKKAISLGLSGWVRNLPDGRVEVMAGGHKDVVLQLFEWLKIGPELAKVTEVSYEELPWQAFQRFDVL